MTTDLFPAGIKKNWPFLRLAKKRFFFYQKSVLPKKNVKSANIFIREKGTFLFVQLFPVVAKTWLIKKSGFCHGTPNLVNGPFVALGETVHFAPWDRFFDFPFPDYGLFLKKKRPTRPKNFPHPLWRHLLSVTALALWARGLDIHSFPQFNFKVKIKHVSCCAFFKRLQSSVEADILMAVILYFFSSGPNGIESNITLYSLSCISKKLLPD